jgi:hypothetical protein
VPAYRVLGARPSPAGHGLQGLQSPSSDRPKSCRAWRPSPNWTRGRRDRLLDRRGRTGEEPAGRRSERAGSVNRKQAPVLAGDPWPVLRDQPPMACSSSCCALGRSGRRSAPGQVRQAGGPAGAASATGAAFPLRMLLGATVKLAGWGRGRQANCSMPACSCETACRAGKAVVMVFDDLHWADPAVGHAASAATGDPRPHPVSVRLPRRSHCPS